MGNETIETMALVQQWLEHSPFQVQGVGVQNQEEGVTIQLHLSISHKELAIGALSIGQLTSQAGMAATVQIGEREKVEAAQALLDGLGKKDGNNIRLDLDLQPATLTDPAKADKVAPKTSALPPVTKVRAEQQVAHTTLTTDQIKRLFPVKGEGEEE
jgi:hypothetical protein